MRHLIKVTSLVTAALTFGLAGATWSGEPMRPIGDVKRGAALISQFGCNSCHTVPGIGGAVGNVGPPLTKMGSRVYIAGMLANTPENMVRWLRHPQEVVPGNAMPDLGLSEKDASDLAAFIATLR
jgi:cytochrome c2